MTKRVRWKRAILGKHILKKGKSGHREIANADHSRIIG